MRLRVLALLLLVVSTTGAHAEKLDWQQVANQCNAAHGMLTETDFMQASPLQRRDTMDCVDYYYRHGRMPPSMKALQIDGERHTDWIRSLCMQSRDYDDCKAWAAAIRLTQTEARQLSVLYHKERL